MGNLIVVPHVGIDGGEMKLDGFMIVCDEGGADSFFFLPKIYCPM